MVASVVERATSHMLIGPDWARNLEICDTINRRPEQVKGVVKGLKTRIGSKNPKVQLLALTLLETIIKNCGDIVHMNVAEKGLPREMVKIYKKKLDYQVKEKILILIDTWQEAFGGRRAKYPQYFAAYQDLLHAGAVFPQKSERAPPIFTPPQSHPLSSYPQNTRFSEFTREGAKLGSSAEAGSSTLSLSEIQKVRGIVDVLSDMLNATSSGNMEALTQETLLDLVEQCRAYKKRAVHLVNSTVDESMLCQGLALNDDLERVLAKHERVVSGVSAQPVKTKPDFASQDYARVESTLAGTGESSKQASVRYTSEASTVKQSSQSAPPAASATPKADPKVNLLCDLLSGDDFSSSTQNSLALVPVSAPQPASPVASEQSALALVDLFSTGGNTPNHQSGPTPVASQSESQQQQHLHSQQSPPYKNATAPNTGSLHEHSGYSQDSFPSWGDQAVQLQQQQQLPQQQQQHQLACAQYQKGIAPHIGSPYDQQGHPQVSSPSWTAQSLQMQQQLSDPPYQNGKTPNMGSPHEQTGRSLVSSSTWLAQSTQLQQQPSTPIYSGQNGGSLPPPPWESQSTDIQLYRAAIPSNMQISTMGSPQSPRVQTIGLPTPDNDQIVGMFVQPITGGQLMALNQSFQMPTIYTQNPQSTSDIITMLPQAMQATQMSSIYPQQMHGSQMASHGYGGYGQHQDGHFLEQKMCALSVKDVSSSEISDSSYLPPIKHQAIEGDKLSAELLEMAPMPTVKQQPSEGTKLFGDLVDMAKFKPRKTPTGRAGGIDL